MCDYGPPTLLLSFCCAEYEHPQVVNDGPACCKLGNLSTEILFQYQNNSLHAFLTL